MLTINKKFCFLLISCYFSEILTTKFKKCLHLYKTYMYFPTKYLKQGTYLKNILL